MKKFVLILVGVALGAGLLTFASYSWVASRTEATYRAMLNDYSRAGLVLLENQSYRRGLFRSQARTVVEISGQVSQAASEGGDGPAAAQRFVLVHDIHHGPLLKAGPEGQARIAASWAYVETRLSSEGPTSGDFAEALAKVPELADMRLYTRVGWSGQSDFQFILPPFERSFEEEGEHLTLKCQGIRAQADFDRGFRTGRGQGSAPALEVVGPRGEVFKMVDLRSDFDLKEAFDGLLLGNSSFSLGQFQIAAPQEEQPQEVAVHGLKVDGITRLDGDAVNYLYQLGVDRVRIEDALHGPGELELECRNLDGPTMARMQKLVEEAQSRQAADSGAFMELLPALFKWSPELEITRLSMKTTEGDFQGKAKLVLAGDQVGAMLHPLMLLQALSAQGEFTVAETLLQTMLSSSIEEKLFEAREAVGESEPSDEELAVLADERARQQIEAALASNFLVREGDQLKTVASFEQGQAVVNGKELQLQ